MHRFSRALPLLLVISACTHREPNPVRYGTFFPIRKEIYPSSIHFESDHFLTTQLWTPLLEVTEGQYPVSCLAKRISQGTERRVWRFLLRDSLKWSDGSPMTAGDLVDAIQKVLKRPSLAGLADQILGVEAPSSAELVVRFKSFSPLLLRMLASPESALLDPKGPQDGFELGREGIRFSGRFRVSQAGLNRVFLEPNPFFPEGCAPARHSVEITGGIDEKEIPSKLLASELDVAGLAALALSDADRKTLERSGIRAYYSPADTMSAFFFGHTKLSKRNRRFVMQLLGRAQVPDSSSREIRATGILPPTFEGALGEKAWVALLPEPVSKDAPKHLTVYVMDSHVHSASLERSLRILQANVSRVDLVTYHFENQDSPTLRAREAGDFDLLFFTTGILYPDAVSYLQGLGIFAKTFSLTLPGIEHIDRVRLLPREKRQARLGSIEKLNADDPVLVPLSLFHSLRLVAPHLSLGSDTSEFPELELWKISGH